MKRAPVVAVLTVAVVLVVVGCANDRSQRAGDERATTTALGPYVDDQWTKLPPSPVGEWSQYNWVWLRDGSGFVHAGAADPTPVGTVRSTREAAMFDFAKRRYVRLPPLPVTSGVGRASGARVGDVLVIVGQDCPPMPGYSFTGVEFCASGGMGAKVVLTHELGSDRWVTHEAPEWMENFRYGEPTVLGVRDGEVVVKSVNHFGRFDPATGAWVQMPDGPTAEAQSVEYCMVGDELIGYALAYSPAAARWWRYVEPSWVEVPAPVVSRSTAGRCGPHGVDLATSALSDTVTWSRVVPTADGLAAQTIDFAGRPDDPLKSVDALVGDFAIRTGDRKVRYGTEELPGGRPQPRRAPEVAKLSAR